MSWQDSFDVRGVSVERNELNQFMLMARLAYHLPNRRLDETPCTRSRRVTEAGALPDDGPPVGLDPCLFLGDQTRRSNQTGDAMIHQAAYAAGIQNIRLHRPPPYYGQHIDPRHGAVLLSPIRDRRGRPAALLRLTSSGRRDDFGACLQLAHPITREEKRIWSIWGIPV